MYALLYLMNIVLRTKKYLNESDLVRYGFGSCSNGSSILQPTDILSRFERSAISRLHYARAAAGDDLEIRPQQADVPSRVRRCTSASSSCVRAEPKIETPWVIVASSSKPLMNSPMMRKTCHESEVLYSSSGSGERSRTSSSVRCQISRLALSLLPRHRQQLSFWLLGWFGFSLSSWMRICFGLYVYPNANSTQIPIMLYPQST